jgi:hypothetical protein
MNYPTIGEYNQWIQKNGGNSFRLLNGINFIPSRTSPIKVYLYGSGAYAAVFKGNIHGCFYAIRCFLSAEDETISRYRAVCKYLKEVNPLWKTDCEFLEDEIFVNGYSYPILKMEWLNGLLINQFVSNNLNSDSILTVLQEKLVSISEDLESHKIGHGDIQCGNIIITGTSDSFEIKLIDYDGMFVPELENMRSIENGRSEFQHPKRSNINFNHEIDRFSFWVIITALEALKLDKSLWKEVMQGGFNTLDNFLFTIQDFLNPNQSALFNRLNQLNSTTLNFYIDTLRRICNSDISVIPKPVLYDNSSQTKRNDINELKNTLVTNLDDYGSKSSSNYTIVSNNCSASVLTSTLQRLGSTPMDLEKSTYYGRTILISNGKVTKRIKLDSNYDTIEVEFD